MLQEERDHPGGKKIEFGRIHRKTHLDVLLRKYDCPDICFS